MCGIAGVFGEANPATVEAMLSRLVHRGPDDSFMVSGPEFTLGAQRLAIIDVEGGRQPLSNESATVWACQNGELYNFVELGPELEARGHRLRTRSVRVHQLKSSISYLYGRPPYSGGDLGQEKGMRREDSTY